MRAESRGEDFIGGTASLLAAARSFGGTTMPRRSMPVRVGQRKRPPRDGTGQVTGEKYEGSHAALRALPKNQKAGHSVGYARKLVTG